MRYPMRHEITFPIKYEISYVIGLTENTPIQEGLLTLLKLKKHC